MIRVLIRDWVTIVTGFVTERETAMKQTEQERNANESFTENEIGGWVNSATKNIIARRVARLYKRAKIMNRAIRARDSPHSGYSGIRQRNILRFYSIF